MTNDSIYLDRYSVQSSHINGHYKAKKSALVVTGAIHIKPECGSTPFCDTPISDSSISIGSHSIVMHAGAMLFNAAVAAVIFISSTLAAPTPLP